MCVNAHAMRKRPQSYELFLNEDGLPWLFFVFLRGKFLPGWIFVLNLSPWTVWHIRLSAPCACEIRTRMNIVKR